MLLGTPPGQVSTHVGGSWQMAMDKHDGKEAREAISGADHWTWPKVCVGVQDECVSPQESRTCVTKQRVSPGIVCLQTMRLGW